MTNKKTMKEVLHTDKDIIENLTRENYELKQDMDILKKKQDYMDSFLEKHGFKDPEDLVLFISNHSNPVDIKSSSDYMELQNKNKIMEQKIEDLNIKLNKLSNNKNDELEIIKIENNKQALPTPSNSSDNKNIKSEDNNIHEIPKLPEDLNTVVFYRNYKNKACIIRNKDKKNVMYLECCGTIYEDILLSKNNHVTCNKCYISYIIEQNIKIDINYNLINTILKEHIINNEKDILSKIRCNTCDFINKKQIDICLYCKKEQNAAINEFKNPNKKEAGYEAKLLIAKETHNKVKYNAEILQKAIDDGIAIAEIKLLIKYIKENKLVEEKQSNIIQNKIIRCHSIIHLYNNKKYENIKDYIQRINFSVKAISKLDEKQWSSFRYKLTCKLNMELENIKQDIKDINVKLENIDENNKLDFVCKNNCCEENVNKEDIFCDSCKKDLKNCKNCKEEFWTDEIDNKYCDDCSSDDEDGSTDD